MKYRRETLTQNTVLNPDKKSLEAPERVFILNPIERYTYKRETLANQELTDIGNYTKTLA